MENILKVTDKYRINELSVLPGGKTIIVKTITGNTRAYDKVKNVESYVKRMKKIDIESVYLQETGQLLWKRERV